MQRRLTPAAFAFALLASVARVASADEEPSVAPAPPPPAEETPPAGNPWLPKQETPKPTDHWAAKPVAKPAPPPAKPTRWYGWQTLLVDAAATTLMVVTVAESRNPGEGAISLLWPTRLLDDPPKTSAAMTGSLFLYTLGPAFVHALHDRGVQAALSPGIRLFAPTLGTITGAVYGIAGALIVEILDDSRGTLRDGSPAQTVLIGCIGSGYVLGFAAPMLIDAFAFAREPVEPDGAAGAEKARGPTIRPDFAWSRSGGSVGISGTF